MKVENDSLHVLYGFNGSRLPWLPKDNPLADGDLLYERETGNSHNLQAVAIKKTIDGTLQVIGWVPRKMLSICSIFLRRGGNITHMRLYYRCSKIWMMKIWQTFGQSSISQIFVAPKFPSIQYTPHVHT